MMRLRKPSILHRGDMLLWSMLWGSFFFFITTLPLVKADTERPKIHELFYLHPDKQQLYRLATAYGDCRLVMAPQYDSYIKTKNEISGLKNRVASYAFMELYREAEKPLLENDSEYKNLTMNKSGSKRNVERAAVAYLLEKYAFGNVTQARETISFKIFSDALQSYVSKAKSEDGYLVSFDPVALGKRKPEWLILMGLTIVGAPEYAISFLKYHPDVLFGLQSESIHYSNKIDQFFNDSGFYESLPQLSRYLTLVPQLEMLQSRLEQKGYFKAREQTEKFLTALKDPQTRSNAPDASLSKIFDVGLSTIWEWKRNKKPTSTSKFVFHPSDTFVEQGHKTSFDTLILDTFIAPGDYTQTVDTQNHGSFVRGTFLQSPAIKKGPDRELCFITKTNLSDALAILQIQKKDSTDRTSKFEELANKSAKALNGLLMRMKNEQRTFSKEVSWARERI